MSTLREAAEPDWLDDEPFYNAMQRYRCAPREDQREVVACFEAVKRLVRSELAKPDARPAPAEPQPIAAWSIVRTAESAVVTAVRAALSAAPAPQPAGGERERYEFVLAQCREAQDIAASRGWALNDIATASTTDPKARKIATEALLGAPQVQRAGLTDEQIDRHSIAAADCPPSSTVILVSSLRRLLGITATKGDRHD